MLKAWYSEWHNVLCFQQMLAAGVIAMCHILSFKVNFMS